MHSNQDAVKASTCFSNLPNLNLMDADALNPNSAVGLISRKVKLGAPWRGVFMKIVIVCVSLEFWSVM